jgi:DNA-binding NarL/FixJ family response regulator
MDGNLFHSELLHCECPRTRATVKVLLVDDHRMFRAGLSQLLATAGDFDLLQAGSCETALALLGQHDDVQVILLDLGLPDMNGMDLLSKLRTSHASIPVVILSATEDPATVIEAINRGAMAFLSKASEEAELSHALERVLQGNTYIPPSIIERFALSQTTVPALKQPPTTEPSAQSLGLTERQAEVLMFLVQGLPNKLIARKMDVTEATVKAHGTSIFRALNVSNRTQAVLAVCRLNLNMALPRIAH